MLSPSLTQALALRRTVLNPQVAQARQRWPNLDVAAFSGFVGSTLDPLCMAVDARDPAATLALVDAGFALGLELVAQGVAGPLARTPWVDCAWQALASPSAHLLARQPHAVLATLANTVIHLDGVSGVDVAQWIERMAAAAPACDDLSMLREAGALCAWQAGMAHFRQVALDHATCLPQVVGATAMAIDVEQWPQARSRLLVDRWWHPSSMRSPGQAVGGFTGFGGPFSCPPQLRATADGFIARCGDRCFLLMADAFGGVVLPATGMEFERASAAPAERFVRDHLPLELVAAGELTAVCGPAGVAVFSPWSHHVFLQPEAA